MGLNFSKAVTINKMYGGKPHEQRILTGIAIRLKYRPAPMRTAKGHGSALRHFTLRSKGYATSCEAGNTILL